MYPVRAFALFANNKSGVAPNSIGGRKRHVKDQPQQNGGVQMDEGLKARMAERLRDVRMTQAEVARHAGVHENQVQRWISGSTRVPAEFLARYVEVVPVNPRWLLTGEGNPDTPADATEAAYRAGAREVTGVLEDIVRDLRARYG
jgi:transcriptional regulator with XRE-family HTH domain